VDKDLEARAMAAPERKERYLALRGKAAVANALRVWQEYRARFFGPEFESHLRAGARPQWLLWASTGTKNPSYSDIKYVEELAGPDSINTMPRETLDAFLDHGTVDGNRLDPQVEPARGLLQEFAGAGISLDAHCDKLLVDGVKLFATSFEEMMAVIRERSAALTRG
jgi:transaldolase